ncbi:MAG TPA: hypothetical protein VIV12_16495 [Streptosporangiaceae bacterium]
MMSTQETRLPSRRRAVGRGAERLMGVEALSFALASVAHFATDFRDAAIPELLIAVVLAIGTWAVLSQQAHAWGIALGATAFATAGTALGLTIIATGRQDIPDLAYHAGILSALCATLIILIRGGRARRRAVGLRSAGTRGRPDA